MFKNNNKIGILIFSIFTGLIFYIFVLFMLVIAE